MAATTWPNGSNLGFQLEQNHGNITANFVQSESPLNQECLRDLRTTNPYDDKSRIQATNGGLLKDSYRWILHNEEFKQWQNSQGNLLWIRGDPGKGKTMLLCGIIDEIPGIAEEDTSISFFFCQATDPRINTATAVLRCLIYSLILKKPSLLSHVRVKYEHTGKQLFDDINAWGALTDILTDILDELACTYLLVDALDECTTGLSSLIDFIVQQSAASQRVKWVITSRNCPEIYEPLQIATGVTPISLELNEASISEAVRSFIQYKVGQLAVLKKYNDETQDKVSHYLSSNAHGTFLWVSLVCRNLTRASRWHALETLKGLPPGLDALYDRMVEQVHKSEDAELCKKLLATISTVYRPITLAELQSCVDLPEAFIDDYEAISDIIAFCGSFLTLQHDKIVFVHQSAKDFLLTKALPGIFPGSIEAEHYNIFFRSHQVMSKILRRDIFDIKLPGLSAKEVPRPDPNPLAAAGYSCVYWADHLENCNIIAFDNGDFAVGGTIDLFLRQKYLHWLEALSLLNSVFEGVIAMLKLDALLLKMESPQEVTGRAHDALRFFRFFKSVIEQSPLQIYCSPSIFSPALSMTAACYKKEWPNWVTIVTGGIEFGWSRCLQTLVDNSQYVAWHDDNRLASTSGDGSIQIYDPKTGRSLSTLKGKSKEIIIIAWSHDGSCLATSGFHLKQGISEIWDPCARKCISKLKSDEIFRSIAWSHSNTRLATASYSNEVKIWDVDTGHCTLALVISEKEHGTNMLAPAIAWSHDDTRLASACQKAIKIWATDTGQCSAVLKTEQTSGCIAWLPCDNRILASSVGSVLSWDLNTGQHQKTPDECLSEDLNRDSSPGKIFWHVDFSISHSRNGIEIAFIPIEYKIKIWNPITGQCTSIFDDHKEDVCCISWSPDGSRLASGGRDSIIRIWNPIKNQCISILRGHIGVVSAISWSQDGKRLLSWSKDDGTIRVWDSSDDASSSLKNCHDEEQTLAIEWCNDGRRLASVSRNQIEIWDKYTMNRIWKSKISMIETMYIQISWSSHGAWLALLTDLNTIQVWDSDTGTCLSTLTDPDEILYFTWSHDGTKIASTPCSDEHSTVKIWNPLNCQILSTLEGHDEQVREIAWSPSGARFASVAWEEDGTRVENSRVMIWDLETEECIWTFESQYGISSMSWSDDNIHLAVGCYKGNILKLDVASHETMTLVSNSGPVYTTSAGPRYFSWSEDGSKLASVSFDGIVNIWNKDNGHCMFTTHVGSCGWLGFSSSDPNILHTQVGTFHLPPEVSHTAVATRNSGYSGSLPQPVGYGFNHDKSWITFEGQQLLWIPPEYRPASDTLLAISGNTVVIGRFSGNLWLNFADSHPISSHVKI